MTGQMMKWQGVLVWLAALAAARSSLALPSQTTHLQEWN
jgi:hypothetical protein